MPPGSVHRCPYGSPRQSSMNCAGPPNPARPHAAFSQFNARDCGRRDETRTRGGRLMCVVIACTAVTADAVRITIFLAILVTGLYSGLYGDHTNHRSESPDRRAGRPGGTRA